jgi:hypothetical protein
MTVMEPNASAAGPEQPIDLDVGAATEAEDTAAAQVPDYPAQAISMQTADPSAAPLEPGIEDRPDGSSLTADDLLRRTNGAVQEADAGAAAPGVIPHPGPRPIPAPIPRPLPFRAASGTYRSQPVGFQLELRVDIDGRRPLRKLSGDYFSVSGSTTTYFGSWTVDAVKVTASANSVVVVGTARTTWATTFTVAKVTIPRATIFQPAPPATIQWSTSSGAQGAKYVCAWATGSFRVVELEQDCERGVNAFTSYNTGSLPSGGPARTLTVAGAYAEAGIQMLDTGGANIIATPANHTWNNASLHHAMQTHFSRWAERPQFKVWLLHAMRHEYGVGLRGIMFDQQGLQRQGCASFYQAISAGTAANLREQLYVHTHELGHCFNLYHSFHKSYMKPPLPNRPGSLSWMNYPQNYNPGGGAPSGAAAFWSAFPFQFDDLELAHLRHGFRNAVIMGGNPFGTGAALEVTDEFADRVSDTSGLELRIEAAEQLSMLGTPVVLQINLIAARSQQVHRREQLHPKFGVVHVAVSRPRGDVVAYQPPVQHCVEPELVLSGHDEEQPVSAYIGYDAAVGQVFEDPGTYRIRASYVAADGTMIVSNTAAVRILSPRTTEDEEVAGLMLADQTGMTLTLLGSDSEHLAEGRNALETVLAEHADHPTSVFAKLALGTNAARPFTAVDAEGNVDVREPDLARADTLLTEAIDASRGDAGLDDLTVLETLEYLADSHEAAGDEEMARSMHQDALLLADSKDAPRSVRRSLEE